MDERPRYIGGDTSSIRFASLFLVGVVVGTAVRTGMWLLPDGVVEAVKGLLPGQ